MARRTASTGPSPEGTSNGPVPGPRPIQNRPATRSRDQRRLEGGAVLHGPGPPASSQTRDPPL